MNEFQKRFDETKAPVAEQVMEWLKEAKNEVPFNREHYRGLFKALREAGNLGTYKTLVTIDGPLLLDWFDKWFGK